jgi:hypothetical protein
MPTISTRATCFIPAVVEVVACREAGPGVFGRRAP